MKITKRELKILDKYFGIYNDSDFSLEQWTNGGVDMFISIDKKSDMNLVEQLEKYVEDFNIDEEIDMYRQAKDYKDAFTITESLNDFNQWLEYVKDVVNKLKKEVE